VSTLTDKAIRAVKPREKAFKVAAGLGLYLLVQPTGKRLWRFKYRINGKEFLEALGSYPEVSLADARTRRDDLRRLHASGVDLAAHRRAAKAALTSNGGNSFEVIAREWYEKIYSPNKKPEHAQRILSRLEKRIFPWLGTRPIKDMTASEILLVLRRIEDGGQLETAHRALGDISAIMKYAIATDRAASDPCRDLKRALPPTRVRHLAAVTDPKDIAVLMRAIHGYQGGLVVRTALRLAPLVFVRPGELRAARWDHIDLDAAEWRFNASKTNQPHIVPLSTQAVALLRELQPLTGKREFVFPSERSPLRPMSENTINAALRSLAIDKKTMCGHGFRAMARTALDEQMKFSIHLIEAQLAHAVRDANGRAYNRTTHIEERRLMMQRWADYLDALRSPKVTPMLRTA
jgi:integrase